MRQNYDFICVQSKNVAILQPDKFIYLQVCMLHNFGTIKNKPRTTCNNFQNFNFRKRMANFTHIIICFSQYFRELYKITVETLEHYTNLE